ncbi:MAG: hypothetical protein GF334_00885 [Candidatus Altiarchaeales archaeon]|nr:hypothetical protein [Candidatus Altiarchaeales archaeon]
MASRDRDTYVHRLGVTPETASVISSKNKIYSTPADSGGELFQIGVVATFDPSETRAIEPVRGIGYGDHVAELVPGVTDPMTLTVTRTAQYLSMVYQIFGYKGGVDGLVRSLRHHKWPFDMVQEIVLSQLIAEKDQDISNNPGVDNLNPDNLRAVLTYYEGCWISDYSSSYASDAALVQENVTVNVTDIIADPAEEYEETDDLFNLNAISRIITQSNGYQVGQQPEVNFNVQT